MPHRKQQISCLVELRVGGEELAIRRFLTADEGATWLLSTGAKLRGAVDAELMEKIADKFEVEIVATVTEDAHSGKVPIFSGKLRAAEDGLLGAVRDFETRALGEFHLAAEKAGRERRSRRLFFQIGGAVAGAAAIALGYFGLKSMPAMFDTEALGDRLLSAPPPAFAGAWRPQNATDGCDSSRIDFKRAQMDLAVAGRLRTFNATYASPNEWTLNVEYTDGGVRVSQTFRNSPEAGSMQLLSVSATDPEVQAAARRLVGVRFVRCR